MWAAFDDQGSLCPDQQRLDQRDLFLAGLCDDTSQLMSRCHALCRLEMANLGWRTGGSLLALQDT